MNIEILKGFVFGLSLVSIIGYLISALSFNNYRKSLGTIREVGCHICELSFIVASIALAINIGAIVILLLLMFK